VDSPPAPDEAGDKERNTMSKHAKYIEDSWGDLVGCTITKVRAMTPSEMSESLWYEGGGSIPIVIELNDGRVLIPSSDPEGNMPGHIFVEGADDV